MTGDTTGSEDDGRFKAFMIRDFRLLWIGTTVSNIGTWAHVVVQGWLMYQITDSPLWLGYIGLARAVPLLTFPLIGGIVADRFSRLKVLYVTQSFALVLAATLAIITFRGMVQPWHLLGFSLLTAFIQAFDGPARQALLPDLVPAEAIVSAVSFNSWSFNTAILLGPAVAAALVPLIGFAGVFALNAASFGAVLVVLPLLRVKDETLHAGSALQNLVEGMRYIRSSPLVLPLVALTATVSLLGRSYAHLMPVFARDALGLDAAGMSILYTVAGLGAVSAAILMAGARSLPPNGKLAIGGAMGVAIFMIIFATSRTLLLSEAALFCLGAALVVFSTSTTSTLQIVAPKEFRGRVMSVNQIAWQGLEYLGVLLTGALATAFTVTPVLIVAGVLIVVIILVGLRLRPDVATTI